MLVEILVCTGCTIGTITFFYFIGWMAENHESILWSIIISLIGILAVAFIYWVWYNILYFN